MEYLSNMQTLLLEKILEFLAAELIFIFFFFFFLLSWTIILLEAWN